MTPSQHINQCREILDPTPVGERFISMEHWHQLDCEAYEDYIQQPVPKALHARRFGMTLRPRTPRHLESYKIGYKTYWIEVPYPSQAFVL